MGIFNCKDDEFEKALVQYDADTLVKKYDNKKYGLSNEIWETNRALDAMNCLLSTANIPRPQINNTINNTQNIQNIQNNYYLIHNHNNNRLKNRNTKQQHKPKTSYSKNNKNTNVNHICNKPIVKPINNKPNINTNKNRNQNKNNKTNNKSLYNENYIKDLKEITQKVLSYQLVTDFYNYNKKVSCCNCKLITFHPVTLSSNTNLCYNCFIQKYSRLKTNSGKNNYNNSKKSNCKSFSVFLQTLKEEITNNICKNNSNNVIRNDINDNNSFINLAFKINKIISSNSLDSKSFYKWKKLLDMNYFEKDYWCLNRKDIPSNVNKQKVNAYTFSIAYHPKKDIFTISINPYLLKLFNINTNNNNNNNNVYKIELYFPFQNYLFVDTAYQALSNLMLNKKTQCLENNNINGLINQWNYYCQQFNNILSVYKNMRENYQCNEELQKIKI